MKKKILIIVGVIFLFALTYVAGHYRILPVHHIRTAIDYVDRQFSAEEAVVPRPTDGVEFLSTHLTRLLVKKIPLEEYDGYGGGISATGDLIFIASNKGDVSIFDAENYSRLEDSISPAPMNFNGLIDSGHTSRNSFREWWFRVNGFYSEETGNNSYSLYFSHNYYDSDRDCISHHISKVDVVRQNGVIDQQGEWVTLFSAEPCFDPEPEAFVSAVPYSGHISGGAIQSFDDENLLITIGDYNHHGLGEMPNYSQNPEIPYGKFILLNKRTGNWSVFASGTRNPSGLFIDNDGIVWSVENGPEGGDELNIIREGNNYGWPEVSHGIWYTADQTLSDSSDAGRHSGFEGPVYSWIPSLAPSSLIKLESERFPLWEGDLLVGAMRGQGIRRLRLNEDYQVVYDEEIYFGHRIRAITTLQNGLIALLTDDRYLIVLDNGGASKGDPEPSVAGKMSDLELFNNMVAEGFEHSENRSPAMVFEQRCAACHLLNRTSEIGPHLNGLLGREVGGAEDFNYSGVLSQDQRVWDEDLLRTFLMDPQSEFNGNRMNKIELTDSETDKLIRFFESREGE